jgi:hypothetical protein
MKTQPTTKRVPAKKTPGVNTLRVFHARVQSPVENIRESIRLWPEFTFIVFTMDRLFKSGPDMKSVELLIDWLETEAGLFRDEAEHLPLKDIKKVIEDYLKPVTKSSRP